MRSPPIHHWYFEHRTNNCSRRLCFVQLILPLFQDNPCKHPIVIFRNVKFHDLRALIDFIYQGEVNVMQDQLSSFLATAKFLEVKGLADNNFNSAYDKSTNLESEVNIFHLHQSKNFWLIALNLVDIFQLLSFEFDVILIMLVSWLVTKASKNFMPRAYLLSDNRFLLEFESSDYR